MDMSVRDFLYLLEVPVEVVNLKAIIVSSTGWANGATTDIIYNILHMMGRDDIPVGIGDFFAMNQSDPIFPPIGECKCMLRPFLMVVSMKNLSSRIQEVYVVGGHASDKGNVFSVPSSKYSEFNMFVDPLAAEAVFQSEVNITLIPLSMKHRTKKTPEATFSKRLLKRLYRFKQSHHRYQHMDAFLGEILGTVDLADSHSSLNAKFDVNPIKVLANGIELSDGEIVILYIMEHHGL
ncbi:hypothetical protein TanjilG_16442 [Lupinus angustifolius]|uniref:Inosine/uridine-preferring nucleoside hydrolase domain-containing protein n=1 Tax=Lupinus angustifolius TaxID=3871 RepID=A0A1J7HQV3_LUPAN|nr:hypothetical protein TanjilG_16442 [Lupinus angustifolius]